MGKDQQLGLDELMIVNPQFIGDGGHVSWRGRHLVSGTRPG